MSKDNLNFQDPCAEVPLESDNNFSDNKLFDSDDNDFVDLLSAKKRKNLIVKRDHCGATCEDWEQALEVML